MIECQKHQILTHHKHQFSYILVLNYILRIRNKVIFLQTSLAPSYRVINNDCQRVWAYCSGLEATYKLGYMSFSSLCWDILISSYPKFPFSSSNYPPWKTFEVLNWKYMENTMKIKYSGSKNCETHYSRER